MIEFATKVCMKVDNIQSFNRDLREPLKKMGWEINLSFWMGKFQHDYLACIPESKMCGLIGDNSTYKGESYFIDEYNPELFLALAAMSKSDDLVKRWVVGEYLFKNGRLIKIEEVRNDGWLWSRDFDRPYSDYDNGGKNYHNPLDQFVTKPPIQMLVNHFGIGQSKNSFKLPERWCIKDCEIVTEYATKKWGCVNLVSEDGEYYHENSLCEAYSEYDKSPYCFDTKISDHTEITIEEFKEYILTDEKMNNKFPFKLEEVDAKRIIKIACTTWRTKLLELWASKLIWDGYVMIDESFYKEMRKACTDEQHELFNEIFGEDEDDLNMMINKEHDPCVIEAFSNEILGNMGAISITTHNNVHPHDNHLIGRALSIDANIEVIGHEGVNGKTILEFRKKK